MRVLFLQQQPCIRALKEAAGLRSVLDGLVLGFAYQGRRLGEWYGTGDELFDRWFRLGADVASDLREALAVFQPDLVHSHNLPDRLTVLALQLAGGRMPVVHDTHDLQSLRVTPYEDGFPEPADPLALERQAVEGATALVTVSEEMEAEVLSRHKMPATRVRFANYALARDLPRVLPAPGRPSNGPPRIVYQGTLSTNGGHYDLRGLFREIVAGGARLDIYPSRPVPEYEELALQCRGMRCLPRLDPRALLRVLPEYDYGWAGFNATLNAAHLDTALPNKVFEYLGCGLPILTFGHRAVARLVHQRGVGLVLDGPGDLRRLLGEADLEALRRRVADTRADFTVEANIHVVGDLYKSLTA